MIEHRSAVVTIAEGNLVLTARDRTGGQVRETCTAVRISGEVLLIEDATSESVALIPLHKLSRVDVRPFRPIGAL